MSFPAAECCAGVARATRRVQRLRPRPAIKGEERQRPLNGGRRGRSELGARAGRSEVAAVSGGRVAPELAVAIEPRNPYPKRSCPPPSPMPNSFIRIGKGRYDA